MKRHAYTYRENNLNSPLLKIPKLRKQRKCKNTYFTSAVTDQTLYSSHHSNILGDVTEIREFCKTNISYSKTL